MRYGIFSFVITVFSEGCVICSSGSGGNLSGEEAARQEKRLDGTAQEEKLTLEESCCEEIWSK